MRPNKSSSPISNNLALATLVLVLVQTPSVVSAAETTADTMTPEAMCDAVKASVADAGFSDSVEVTCDDSTAYLSSSTYPDHEMMTGIVGSNEQVPVPAKGYAATVALTPTLISKPHTRDSSLAIAVNGVPIFDYTGGGEMSEDDLYHHQTQHDTLLTQQLDVCGGHAGRGDDYHYHVKPTCMIEAMENAAENAIIGWAFDGFPLYGDNNPDGSAIPDGVLDVCNGQPDESFGYRYHTSESAPYIIQCLMGQVGDVRSLPRVSPLQPAAGSARMEAGRPPRGGVQELVYTDDGSGNRSMDYSFNGEDYYIRYSPSDTPDCYKFESRTVTNAGELRSGEYCR